MAMFKLKRFEANTRFITSAEKFSSLFTKQQEFRGQTPDKTWRWLYLAVFHLPENQYKTALANWKFEALEYEKKVKSLNIGLSERFKSTLLEVKARTLTTGKQFHAMLNSVQEIAAPFRDDPLIMLGIRLWRLPEYDISDARDALADVVRRQQNRSTALDLLLRYAEEDRNLPSYKFKTCPFYHSTGSCFMEKSPESDEAWRVFCQDEETIQACRLRYLGNSREL